MRATATVTACCYRLAYPILLLTLVLLGSDECCVRAMLFSRVFQALQPDLFRRRQDAQSVPIARLEIIWVASLREVMRRREGGGGDQ